MKKLLLTTALMLAATPAFAAEHIIKEVTDDNAKKQNFFSPDKLTIQPGDTVIFENAQDAPHEVMLVLDGSTGQNALEQAKHFTAATDVSALAITKLDGTAKGGVVLAIASQFRIPVKFIGVGEKAEDLLVFDKVDFVNSLFSLPAE